MAAATSSAGRCGSSMVPKPIAGIFAPFAVSTGAFADCIFNSVVGKRKQTLLQRTSRCKLACRPSLLDGRVRNVAPFDADIRHRGNDEKDFCNFARACGSGFER